MKRSLVLALLGTTLIAARAAESTPSAAPSPPRREESILVTLVASIESINLANREVTLKGPLGNSVTFTVDPRVKRLNEFAVGDSVRAEYYISVAAELRKPTPEEEKEPWVVLDAAGRASAESAPAGGAVRRLKVVTTIEGLDRPTQTVTLKGPLGNLLTVRAAEPERLPQLRIGDTVVVVCTEALAVSLEKEKTKPVAKTSRKKDRKSTHR